MLIKYLIIATILLSAATNTLSRGVNGGMSCAVCTVLMGVSLQVAEINEDNFFNTWKNICNKLPTIVRKPCLNIAETLEPYVESITNHLTPDLFCLIYGTCTVDEGQPLCHLFPLPFQEQLPSAKTIQRLKIAIMRQHNVTSLPKIDFCKLPILDSICSILNSSYHSLNAAQDFDKDGFSYLSTARGSDWRGKDCSDSDPRVYPGRKPWNGDIFFDNNCNGVWGQDNETGMSYEQLLCKKYEPRGIIFIGDSIGAHFHMPRIWIDPVLFQWPGLNGSNIILDEIDWPQYGFATGFKNITKNIWIEGPTDSIYWRLRARNRCNHRDYQNLSQNGASSYEGISHASSVTRNQTTDNPAIVFYAMQGNDVCNNFNDTINHITPPEVFRENVMKTLNILENKLPLNSHVILVGLVNGEFIYPAMAKRLHPIGQLHKNVHYYDLYNWFNCMQIGPCNGWLHSNATLRGIITKKAEELTKILQDIAGNEKFAHFKIHFIESPINQVVRKHLDIPKFLEAVDSLHPNQRAQPLLTEAVWNSLPSEVLGPINPHNEEIINLFGEQGGH